MLMRVMRGRRAARAVLAASAVGVGFGVAASVGVAVSPAGSQSAAHQYQYDKKVTICHRTGSKKHPFVTIRVARPAVRSHLAHGDRLGPCSQARFVVCHKAGRARETKKVVGVRALQRHLRHDDRLGPCKRHKGKDGHGKKSDRKRGHD
jgi:hypothetical protein